jgi:hypothetical protein
MCERSEETGSKCGAVRACVGEGEDGVEPFRLAADVTRMDGGWHLTQVCREQVRCMLLLLEPVVSRPGFRSGGTFPYNLQCRGTA